MNLISEFLDFINVLLLISEFKRFHVELVAVFGVLVLVLYFQALKEFFIKNVVIDSWRG